MPEDSLEEKIRRQNRESQRRYRERNKNPQAEQLLIALKMSRAGAQSDQCWPSSTPSATLSSTPKTQARGHIGDNTSNHQGMHITTSAQEFLDDHYEDSAEWVETNPATSTRRPGVQSTHQHSLSVPSSSISSSLFRGPISPPAFDKAPGNSGPYHTASSETDLEHNHLYDFIVSPVSGNDVKHDAFTSPTLSSNHQPHDARTKPQILFHQITPPERGMSSAKRFHENDRSRESAGQTSHRATPATNTRGVSSRAEEMITDVEKVYEFGVNVGIFPEDRHLKSSLWRMKERFRALSRPVSVVDAEISQQESHMNLN